MRLTKAQLKEIKENLFLFKDPPPHLPIPKNIGNLTIRMNPVALEERFKKISFSVVDFTADRFNPQVFLHRAEKAWRMGSTGKIAVLLAAAQLRDDVRNVKNTLGPGVVLSPTEYDDLFSTIWKDSNDPFIMNITRHGGPPRVSTIFDLSKPEPDFLGADVDINRELCRVDYQEASWSKITDISYQDRLWLMGAQSDNISADSCISDIGVAYIKEVQRAYGLFLENKKNEGMRMLLAGGFSREIPNTPVSTKPGAPTYRKLRDIETTLVTDEYFDGGKPHESWQGGSVLALTAYMIALIQEKLVSKEGCDAIKKFLADETVTPFHRCGKSDNRTLPGSLVDGVKDTGIKINKFYGKGGALDRRQSATKGFRCDVAYIETGGSAAKQFAIVAQALVPFKGFTPQVQGEDLAKAIFAALIAP